MSNVINLIGSKVSHKVNGKVGILTSLTSGEAGNKYFVTTSKKDELLEGVEVAPSTFKRYWVVETKIVPETEAAITSTFEEVSDNNDKILADKISEKLGTTVSIIRNNNIEVKVEEEVANIVNDETDNQPEQVINEIKPIVSEGAKVITEASKTITETKPDKKVETPKPIEVSPTEGLLDKIIAHFKRAGVSVKPTTQYTGLVVNKKLFAEIHIGKKVAYSLLMLKSLSDEEQSNVKIIPKSFGWRLRANVVITPGNFDEAMKLFEKSYECVRDDVKVPKVSKKVITITPVKEDVIVENK